MEPKTALLEYKKKVDVELERYLKGKITEYENISEFSGRFTRHLTEYTLRGGKRLRAALIYYSYKLFGGEDEDEIVKLSMFIELIQSFLLMHDDIMDRSLLRRGGMTVHKIYEKYSKEHNFQDDAHFGCTMGILSGDLAKQFALEVIGESHFPAANKNKLISLIASEISKVIFGQIQDILLTYNYPIGYKEEDVLKVHWYKTALYTYKLPLFAGAILTDATDTELKALDGFAMPGGVAFQIRDDIIGVFGKSEETGKEIKGDLIEGKKTLLVTEAYKNGSQDQKEKLDKYLGKEDLTDSEANEVRSIFIDTGSLEYSKEECKSQVEKAKKSLKNLSDKDKESYEFLEGIADYMIVRSV